MLTTFYRAQCLAFTHNPWPTGKLQLIQSKSKTTLRRYTISRRTLCLVLIWDMFGAFVALLPVFLCRFTISTTQCNLFTALSLYWWSKLLLEVKKTRHDTHQYTFQSILFLFYCLTQVLNNKSVKCKKTTIECRKTEGRWAVIWNHFILSVCGDSILPEMFILQTSLSS